MARLVCLLLLCGFVLSGCAADEDITVAELEKFDAYPLYYAGEEVAGHELREILGQEDWKRKPDQRSLGFTFIYGTCEPSEPSGLDGGSCPPPVQIQVSSICNGDLSLYRGEERVFDLHGAKASSSETAVQIFTGRTALEIFASGSPEQAKRIVRQLRQVGAATPPKRLPPPVPGAVKGKLPCQQKRG